MEKVKVSLYLFVVILFFSSCKKCEDIGEFQINDSSSIDWVNTIYKNVRYFNADSSLEIDTSHILQVPPSVSGITGFTLDDSKNDCKYYTAYDEKIILGITGFQFNYRLNARTDGTNKWDVLTITLGKHNPNAGAGMPVFINSGFKFITYCENNSFHWDEAAPYIYHDSLLLDGVLRKEVYHIFANYNSEFYLSKEEGIVAFKFKDEELFYKN